MAYKIKFPIDYYKKVNSILSEYFGDYICRGNLIYGSQKHSWSWHAAITDNSLSPWIQDLLIPPNLMRSTLTECKKTMTYVIRDEDGLGIYITPEKIKEDNPTPKEEEKKLYVKQVNLFEKSAIANSVLETISSTLDLYRAVFAGTCSYCNAVTTITRDWNNMTPPQIVCNTPNCKAKPLTIEEAIKSDRFEFMEIPREKYTRYFSEDTILTLNDEYGDELYVAKESFPKYQTIESIKWRSVPIDDNLAYALFVVDYGYIIVLSIMKYIRGI